MNMVKKGKNGLSHVITGTPKSAHSESKGMLFEGAAGFPARLLLGERNAERNGWGGKGVARGRS